jgi:hypothetical protein
MDINEIKIEEYADLRLHILQNKRLSEELLNHFIIINGMSFENPLLYFDAKFQLAILRDASGNALNVYHDARGNTERNSEDNK